MEQYKNLDGDSGVAFFHIDATSIQVQFLDGSVYLYNYQKPGARYVEQMKILATAGSGLNSYIVKSVKKNFAQKLR